MRTGSGIRIHPCIMPIPARFQPRAAPEEEGHETDEKQQRDKPADIVHAGL
jgi:hypothetical protein